MPHGEPLSPGPPEAPKTKPLSVAEDSAKSNISGKRKKEVDSELRMRDQKRLSKDRDNFEYIGKDDLESRKNAINQMNQFSKTFGFREVPAIEKPYSSEERKKILEAMYRAKG